MRVFLVTPTSTVASYCSFNEKRKRDPSFFFLSARLHCNLYCIEVTIQSSSKKWRSKSSEAHKKSLYVMKVDRYLRSLAYNITNRKNGLYDQYIFIVILVCFKCSSMFSPRTFKIILRNSSFDRYFVFRVNETFKRCRSTFIKVTSTSEIV